MPLSDYQHLSFSLALFIFKGPRYTSVGNLPDLSTCRKPSVSHIVESAPKLWVSWCILLFLFFSEPQAKRTQYQHIKDAKFALDRNASHVRGVQHASIVLLLKNHACFDVVRGFPIDYMHCVLLGVSRHFLGLLINTKWNSCPWYIGRYKVLFLIPSGNLHKVIISIVINFKHLCWNWLSLKIHSKLLVSF